MLFRLAPEVMLVVACIGCFTALFAATIAIAQNDLKKVLAYSTVSQLGYMFLACGVGAFTVGMFHVMTHAFFKACLFLGAGCVMHAMHGELDIRQMGGLKKKMPITYMTFLIATLAIAGIPPFAGFFSKDAILAQRVRSARALGKVFWAIGLLTAGLTAFYMFRVVSLTFLGTFRGTAEQEHHLHESPRSMTRAAHRPRHARDGRRLGRPAGRLRRERERVRPLPVADRHPDRRPGGRARARSPHAVEWLLMAVSVAVAASGHLPRLGLVRRRAAGSVPARLAAAYPRSTPCVADKWRVDELYAVLFVRPFEWLARVLWKVVDVLIIDGVLNASAFLVELAGDFLRFLQTGNVRNYALTFLLGLVALLVFVVGAI